LGKQKYHLGKNGPGPCNAHPERPNGRACRFGEERHGSREEVSALWESEQEELHSNSMLAGASRTTAYATDPLELAARSALSDRYRYLPHFGAGVNYSDGDRDIALKLAEDSFSELSYVPLRSRDMDWQDLNASTSRVERWEFEDGSAGYFKDLKDNSYEEENFEAYGTSSLGAAINEVNAHRLAGSLGGDYSKLVPETVIRTVDGYIGTLQREVREDRRLSTDFHAITELREDYRRAALLDFVMGSLDRHSENYLFESEGADTSERHGRLRLIDNSLSFPVPGQYSDYNVSTFANFEPALHDGAPYGSDFGYRLPESELDLRSSERSALGRARPCVEGWIKDGTIDRERGKSTLDRVDFLLNRGRLSRFEDWYADGAS